MAADERTAASGPCGGRCRAGSSDDIAVDSYPHTRRSDRSLSHASITSPLSKLKPYRPAKRSSSVLLLVLAVTLFLVGGVVPIHAGWPSEFLAPYNYYSTDLNAIEVTLGHPNNRDPADERILLIPRAAIVALAEYDASRVPRLPDHIRTVDIQIALAYPDGKPLSVRAAEVAAASPTGTRVDWRALRQEEYLVNLGPAGQGAQWEERSRQSMSRFVIVDQYDGLPHAPADNYFGNAGVDDFFSIHCYPEANPNYFCEMKMRIGRGVVATARFADFRFKGGRSFANERARWLREVVCRYVTAPC